MIRRKKESLTAYFVLSAAVIDVFAIPLLIIANRSQHAFQHAPVVAESVEAPSQSIQIEPITIRLVPGRPPRFDDRDVSWEQLLTAVNNADPQRQLIVHAETNADGQGPLADLLKLSALSQQHQFADRVLVVSQLPNGQ